LTDCPREELCAGNPPRRIWKGESHVAELRHPRPNRIGCYSLPSTRESMAPGRVRCFPVATLVNNLVKLDARPDLAPGAKHAVIPMSPHRTAAKPLPGTPRRVREPPSLLTQRRQLVHRSRYGGTVTWLCVRPLASGLWRPDLNPSGIFHQCHNKMPQRSLQGRHVVTRRLLCRMARLNLPSLHLAGLPGRGPTTGSASSPLLLTMVSGDFGDQASGGPGLPMSPPSPIHTSFESENTHAQGRASSYSIIIVSSRRAESATRH
jgi:hypothetical protein